MDGSSYSAVRHFAQVKIPKQAIWLPIDACSALGWRRVDDSLLGDLHIRPSSQLVIPNIFMGDGVSLLPNPQKTCPGCPEVFIYLGNWKSPSEIRIAFVITPTSTYCADLSIAWEFRRRIPAVVQQHPPRRVRATYDFQTRMTTPP